MPSRRPGRRYSDCVPSTGRSCSLPTVPGSGTPPPPASPTASTSSTSRPWTGHSLHVSYRQLSDSPRNSGPVSDQLPIRQAWSWCSVPEGHVVLVADPCLQGTQPKLPGGTVKSTDATPEDTLHREAAEEAQLTLTAPVRQGWMLNETGEVLGHAGPNARLRLAARVASIGPTAVDPAIGRPFRPPARRARPGAALLGWDPPGAEAGPTRRGHSTRAGGCPALPPPPSRRSLRRGCH
ncbi:NUDIX hydrolase [Streptomyces fructofermentans]|uniref:NUDIX hydrolase n=1 Tax=Streptomyces fructofermentans TaxID=152141 RepID=UPI0033E797A4